MLFRSSAPFILYFSAIIAAVALLPGAGHTTSIVVVRTPRLIVLATDSLALEGNEALMKTSTCKIQHEGSIYFATAGVSGEAASGFDADKLARRAILQTKSLRAAASRFGLIASPAFSTVLKRIRRLAPNVYQTEIKAHPQPLQTLFVGMESGTPAFVLVYFTIDDDLGGKLKIGTHQSDCPGTCGHPLAIEAIGENDAVKAIPRLLLLQAASNDPISAAKSLVQAEISAAPQRVGPPISIVTLDSTGPAWINTGECMQDPNRD